MQIIGHSDLNGAGKGGEGLALTQYANGKRVLFLAHESAPMCFSIIDVTDPEEPDRYQADPGRGGFLRCNSLGLSGTTLIVAHQTEKPGQQYAGIDIYDVADPANPQKLSHFDTSGPYSRGAHYLWFTDGHYAYLSTGAKDFEPRDQKDDQFLMIVDVSNPKEPKEVGRWWLPGTRVGDAAEPPPRVELFDAGMRLHTPTIPADQPNRLYAGWIDGGWVILDISDKAHPKIDRPPLVAIDGRGVRAHRDGDPLARHRDPDRGGDRQSMQRLAEAQLGVGHLRTSATRSRWRRCRRRTTRPNCARPAAASARTTSNMNRLVAL